jgi:hypothetical protein
VWVANLEDLQPYIIPTLSKAKISHVFSYPIGASALSEVLRSTAQFGKLKVHFYFWSELWLRDGHYEFLRVEYLNNATPAEQYPIVRLHQRPPQYRWEIIVQPMPRIIRHEIKRYILESAIPEIASWLSDRAELAQQDSDMLTFLYDEKIGQFESRPLTRLEPLRSSHESRTSTDEKSRYHSSFP